MAASWKPPSGRQPCLIITYTSAVCIHSLCTWISRRCYSSYALTTARKTVSRLESAMDSLLTAKLSDGTWSACPRALLEAEDTKLKAGRSPNHNLRCKRVGQHAVQATPGVIRKGEMLQGKGGCKRTRARKGRAGVPSFVFHFCKMRVLEEMVSLEFLRPVRYTRPMSEAHKRERKKSGKD